MMISTCDAMMYQWEILDSFSAPEIVLRPSSTDSAPKACMKGAALWQKVEGRRTSDV